MVEADGLSLDAGPFVAAIEFAPGREPDLVGSGWLRRPITKLGVRAGMLRPRPVRAAQA